MVGRFLLATILLAGVTLVAIDYERQYRELQTVRVRQIFQRQVLLEQQSRLRLELQLKSRSQQAAAIHNKQSVR